MSGEAEAGVAARAAALSLIDGALQRRGGIDEALGGPALNGLEPRDRAFARALAMATLRHLRPIDRVIDPRLNRAPPETVRSLLRLGAAQLLYLDTPPHAAVSATVDLAAQNRATRPFKGLVNAVLRAVGREGAPGEGPLAPDWMLARWSAAFGPQAAAAMDAMVAAEPATDLTPRDPSEAAAIAEAVEGEVLSGGSIRTRRRGDLTDWTGYVDGRWWVQDASAAIPARLFDLKVGMTALDLCAAPGGKTLQLAAAGAAVVAIDRSASRLQRVRENLNRMDLEAEIVTAQAETWDDPRSFDAVLLDAPCTATGTFRRHPEALWASRPGDIAKLAAVQSRMLDAAAGRVAPGGTLIYCVCSLEPEEGEAQLAGFLKRHPQFRLLPVAPGEGGAPEASILPSGALRILPHHIAGGTDGFFAARLRRIP